MLRKELCRFILVTFAAGSFADLAAAEVGVRVDARPRSGSIEAYVLPTDDNGAISGLVAEDFVVNLDGAPVESFELTLPPREDPTQKVSIVIVARHALHFAGPVANLAAYLTLVRQLVPGDYVAIVLLGYGAVEGQRVGEVSVLPFRQIDGGAHTEQIVSFLNTGQSDLARNFSDFQFFQLPERGLHHALDQFERHASRLPSGVRAVVTWSVPSADFEHLVTRANENGVSIFSRHLVRNVVNPEIDAVQQTLAGDTGGVVVEMPPHSGSAVPIITSWLKDGYRLTIAAAAADDCGLHMLEVTVSGESASVPFARCDAIPDPIGFTSPPYDVPAGSTVVSEPRRVKGTESPSPVSIVDGAYSIGCTKTFTSHPGYIQPGQVVCVNHVAASRPYGGWTTTKLTIGGVSSRFESEVIP